MFNLFKNKNVNPSFNMHHPDLADKIEFAFESGSIKYYQFVEEHQIRTGRYKWILAYLQEHDLRMTPDALSSYCDQMDAVLNKGEIGKAFIIIEKIRGRTKLAFAPDTIKRLASVIYFDESEDPYSFDYQYAFKKIEKWKKGGLESFFLTTPASKLIPPSLLSEEVLKTFMKVTREIDKEHYQTILDSISGILSEKEKKSEWLKTLNLEKSII